jgi:acid phosphatase (class A)
MKRPAGLVAVAALAAALSCGIAIASAGPAGYLDPGAFDIMQVLPPAPVRGDGRYQADRRIFRATRRFAGSARWDMATRDVSQKSADMLRDFSCAIGVALEPSNAPLTAALVQRAALDTAAQKNKAKDFYKRSRPYKIDRGAVCQPRAELDNSYDYPSGHTTSGWTWALILAELAPDRATRILARGRAYGQSRMICGAHNESAVEAGWLTADATMAVVRTRPAYQADAAAARAEIEQLRHNPAAPRPSACETEEGLVRQRVL